MTLRISSRERIRGSSNSKTRAAPRRGHAAGNQGDGKRHGHERPDRRGEGVRRLDDLGPDAAEVADEPGLLELIDHRVEEYPLAVQVAPQARLGKEVDLRLLGDDQVAVELLLDFPAHRLDGFEASLRRIQEVPDLALFDPAAQAPRVFLNLGHLFLDLLDLGVQGTVPDRQLLLFLVELTEVPAQGWGRSETLAVRTERLPFAFSPS